MAMRIGRVSLFAALTAGLLAGFAGCAGPYQRVGIDSRPSGAQVFADGDEIGVTPLEIRLSTRAEHSVFVKKPGYKPELVVMQRNVPQDDPPPFLTPADVRVRLTRLAPRAPGEEPADPNDPNDPLNDPMGRGLEVDIED